jgi:hypothetical protein
MSPPFRPGEPVIYAKHKFSLHPGPRAREVHAQRAGDGYLYLVDKFWVVEGADEEGRILVRTRRGKTHHIAADDPRLRRPTLWERIRFRQRFPRLEDPDEAPDDAEDAGR